MDFWRSKNDTLVEDWIFVDMIQLFRQFGVGFFKSIPPRRNGRLPATKISGFFILQ